MAPKRRPLDPASRPPKKSKGVNVPVTYDTFEDALDAGVIQEEKGERYRVGDKVGPSQLPGGSSVQLIQPDGSMGIGSPTL